MAGRRADTVSLRFVNDKIPATEQIDMRDLPEDIRGLLDGFRTRISKGIDGKDIAIIVDAYTQAKELVINRTRTNEQAFMKTAGRNTLKDEQSAKFIKEATRLFGVKAFTEVKGKRVISTRTGGTWWYLRQALWVLLNPVSSETTATKQQMSGSTETKVSVKKGNLRPKIELFDDYLHLTEDGIELLNPTKGSDLLFYPWANAERMLALSSNASAYVDPINQYIRPLFKKTAQSPWVPLGALTIRNQQSGQMLVQVLMLHPNEFRVKVQELMGIMKQGAVSDTVTPATPIRIRQYISTLSPDARKKMESILRVWNRRLYTSKWKTDDNGNAFSRIFAFRGKQFADIAPWLVSVKTAMEDAKNKWPELSPKERNELKKSLQQLAVKLEPFVQTKAEKALINAMKSDRFYRS